MEHFNGIKIVSKVKIKDKHDLAVVYTPGVAASCLKIKDNPELSFDYTNRENSVAVISFSYSASLKRAIFLKSTLGIDAYPLEIKEVSKEKLKFIVQNLEPTFCAIDLSIISEFVKDIKFDVGVPVLKDIVPNLKEFFMCVSKTILLADCSKLEGNTDEQSLSLRKLAGGVIETELTVDEHQKPVAIVTDGSAILGLGNIGSLAGLPVMEGKAALFSTLGEVSAVPICLKTQIPEEVIELVQLLENSFSGINLEDISAPNCFTVEKTLIDTLSVPVFHDDQHGTAIVVTAALLNALSIVNKKPEDIKLIFSGAGAAAIAVCKLVLSLGVKNITMFDKNGAVYKDRESNNFALDEISDYTNLSCNSAPLSEQIKGADVFIGLSAPNVLTKEMVKTMADKPIVFALANPVPEIMPTDAKEAGAYIVASGRSDFENQVNNSLVFPGLFNGVLKYGIKKITNEMKLNCAFALASTVKDSELSVNYILPDALDCIVPKTIRENVK